MFARRINKAHMKIRFLKNTKKAVMEEGAGFSGQKKRDHV